MRDDTLVVPVDGGLIRGQRSGTVETWRNSVHLAVRQRCSSSSPSVHYDSGFIVGGTSRLVAKIEFRLFPRGAEPLELDCLPFLGHAQTLGFRPPDVISCTPPQSH